MHSHHSLILAYLQFTCSLASYKWNHCVPLLILICWDILEFPSDFYSFFLWLSVSYTKYCGWKFPKNHWTENKQPDSMWINECCEFGEMFFNIVFLNVNYFLRHVSMQSYYCILFDGFRPMFSQLLCLRHQARLLLTLEEKLKLRLELIIMHFIYFWPAEELLFSN